jgi:hypothetical protein
LDLGFTFAETEDAFDFLCVAGFAFFGAVVGGHGVIWRYVARNEMAESDEMLGDRLDGGETRGEGFYR